jgi:tetratricopeptide (TPR) repeat protein
MRLKSLLLRIGTLPGVPGQVGGPPDVAAFLQLGEARLAAGDPGRALAAYDAALRVDPACAKAHCNRGVALERLGDLAGALEAYDQAIALDPGLARAWANRGNMHAALGDVPAAAADRAEALRLDPGAGGA